MTDSAIISVPAVANANAYRWRLSTDATVDDSDRIISTIVPEVTFDNLLRNEVYWVNVRAENRSGVSMYSETLKFHVKLPETSDAPTLVSRDYYEIEVETDPVDTATKYIWVLSEDATIDGSDTTEETTAPTITFEDLQHSKDYWVAVQAVAPGNSNTHLSDALATATVTLVFQKPTITRTAQTPFSLNYQTASQQEGLFYTWRIGQNANITDANSVQTTTAVQPGNFQTHKFDGLTYATEYYVDVRVENDPAFSDYADTVKVTTPEFSTPANPTNTAKSPFEVTMSIPRNIHATHYTWRIGQSLPLTNDNTVQTTAAATNATNQTHEFTGLAAKSDYYVDVRAENHTYSQNSPYATAVAVTTDEQQLHTPTLPVLVSSGATTMRLSTTVETMYDGSEVVPGIDYTWEYTLTKFGTESDHDPQTVATTAALLDLSSLVQNGEYTIRVKIGSGEAGYTDSEWSEALVTTLPVSAFTGQLIPMVANITGTSMDLSTTSSIRAVDSYKWTIIDTTGSGPSATRTISTADPMTDVTMLTENTIYQIRVQAVNTAGDSAYARNPVVVTTLFDGAPQKPPRLRVLRPSSDVTDTSIKVGGIAVDDRAQLYRFRIYTDNTDADGSVVQEIEVDPATLGIGVGLGTTFTGLNPGITYYFEVRAENNALDGGLSAWSTTAQATTTLTKPATPTATATFDQIIASVAAVPGAASYIWFITIDGTTSQQTTTTPDLVFNITRQGSRAGVAVSAYDSDSIIIGARSSSTSVVIPIPAAPTINVISKTSTSVTFEVVLPDGINASDVLRYEAETWPSVPSFTPSSNYRGTFSNSNTFTFSQPDNPAAHNEWPGVSRVLYARYWLNTTIRSASRRITISIPES